MTGVCDFCNAASPTWDFPCEDFLAVIAGVTYAGEVEAAPQDYRGAWSACETCKVLIEAGEWRALAERGADHPQVGGGLTPDQREAVIQGIATIHEAFQGSRCGAPVRLGA
jgi:hypothetical protein